jgi:2-dehydro-3-deoxygalactonokinase
MAQPALIGIDWGTSAFRAFLLDVDGTVLDRRSGQHGILSVRGGDYAGVLEAQIGAWLEESRAPVIMSGMIGSRQGWVETPYVTCPAEVGDLAAALVHVPFDLTEVRIIPGLETQTAHMRDVMRGEETQVFGALARIGGAGRRFLLPGTHSKWVTAGAGRIETFATYMTGEIYAACRGHTILGKLMTEARPGPAAIARGVREGAAPGMPGVLLHRLFGVRTAGLFGEIGGADLPDFLSGLLIGAELADAGKAGDSVRIMASDQLAERYRKAAAELGIQSEVIDADCIIGGYVTIARLGGLIA